jgi:sugar O-acyltransferase (sialic acid O-acetyltransferase NeuD family)
MKKLAIIGAGDLGQLIAYHATNDRHYSVVGYFDDTKIKGESIEEVTVLGNLSEVEKQYNEGAFDCLMIGIGYNHILARKKIFNELHKLIPFGTIAHSSCYVDSSVKIGEGSFLLPGCIIDRNVEIGKNVLLNTGCVIAHDTSIHNHCFLSPAVKIAGKTIIGECCVLGINTTVIDHIVVEPFIKTGAGSVVIKNLMEPGLYVGIPAILIKKI